MSLMQFHMTLKYFTAFKSFVTLGTFNCLHTQFHVNAKILLTIQFFEAINAFIGYTFVSSQFVLFKNRFRLEHFTTLRTIYIYNFFMCFGMVIKTIFRFELLLTISRAYPPERVPNSQPKNNIFAKNEHSQSVY